MPAGADMLVTPAQLAELIESRRCIAVDCRFELDDPGKGHAAYLAGHIPGAQYAHLGQDLSSPPTALSGRHPLPESSAFGSFLGSIGWRKGKLLVAHDDRNNAMAARLWWLMRYFGQEAALLNGGLEAWVRAGLPLQTGVVKSAPGSVSELLEQPSMVASVTDILGNIGQSSLTLIDARAAERFSGETELLDIRAGHIPGALNRPMGLNLDQFGQFKRPDQLRGEFETLLHGRSVSTVVHSCGSGVTACHNRFAMELADMTPTRVYPGSWSEWVRDESRPVESGN